MKRALFAIIAIVLLALAGVAAWLWWREPSPVPVPVATQEMPTEAPGTTPAATPPAASAPAIQYPIEAEAPAASAAPPADIQSALTNLFGRQAVLSLFQLDGFIARVVATVDNLGRAKASTRLWPLNPVEGRFTVVKVGDREAIGAENAARYRAHVALLDAVDAGQLVALYRRFYPQFQQAYEALGYPKSYFNDRLVEVLDLLIATPDAGEAVAVHRPEIRGPMQPQRPWVLYEFEDPALRALSAGQKILLRMGPGHAGRVKARLAEIRALLVASAPRR